MKTSAIVTNSEEEIFLIKSVSAHIPPGVMNRLFNAISNPLKLIEVQSDYYPSSLGMQR